ncbi:MAG: hypothetical protein ACTHJQ_25490 [Rhizobiaceae bacterium]
MNDDVQPAEKLADLSPETRHFLSKLSPDDLDALGRFIPLIKRLLAFGVVAKWMILTIAVIVIGANSLWDSISSLLSHFRPH